MRQLKILLTVMLSVSALCVAAYGAYRAMHSPLFKVQVVEVNDWIYDSPLVGSIGPIGPIGNEGASRPSAPLTPPLDEQAISSLAAVPVGEVSLFDVDLGAIERRLLSNSWIREVHLAKRFPQTLAISVKFRKPVALYQQSGGEISYIDTDGQIFGIVSLMSQPDLPILNMPEEKISDALRLLSDWQKSESAAGAQISSLNWNNDHGYRAIMVYSLGTRKGRTTVSLGQEFDADLAPQIHRLAQVFRYLSSRGILAHQIWADAHKKIVVKTAHGS